MRIINADTLKSILANLPSNPRIIASGNFATPRTLLAVADEVIPRFKLHVLNAIGKGIPDRAGITYEKSNVQMPYTYGDAQIHESDIDCLIEVDEPLQEKPTNTAIADVQAEIGSRIAALVENHSTLQLGIGGVPDAVLMALKARKGLRIWTEMFSDGVLELEKAGAMDDEVYITASFAFGSQELYHWMDQNKRIRMLRIERTNDPSQIARQPKMTSVNAALEVDLFDQANACYVNGKVYSGFGGSTDFIVGALHSRGGRSFIALPSWHPNANTSTIVPRLQSNVTHFQHSFTREKDRSIVLILLNSTVNFT